MGVQEKFATIKQVGQWAQKENILILQKQISDIESQTCIMG